MFENPNMSTTPDDKVILPTALIERLVDLYPCEEINVEKKQGMTYCRPGQRNLTCDVDGMRKRTQSVPPSPSDHIVEALAAAHIPPFV